MNLRPRATTIAALRALKAPLSLGSSRIGPVELGTYRVHARLVEFKLEEDSDVHLVVADPSTGGTMIVEFPASSCLSGTLAKVKQRIAGARAALVGACGQPSSTHFTHLSGTATITGVGFWDFKHGQAGVAQGLHPLADGRSLDARRIFVLQQQVAPLLVDGEQFVNAGPAAVADIHALRAAAPPIEAGPCRNRLGQTHLLEQFGGRGVGFAAVGADAAHQTLREDADDR